MRKSSLLGVVVGVVAGALLIVFGLGATGSGDERRTATAPSSWEVPGSPAENLIRPAAAPGLAAAEAGQALATRLAQAQGLDQYLVPILTTRAIAIAEEHQTRPGDLATELLALAPLAGVAVSPTDALSLRADVATLSSSQAQALAILAHGVREANALRELALAGLTQGERAELASLALRAGDALGDAHADPSTQAKPVSQLGALESKVDQDALAAAGLVIGQSLQTSMGLLADACDVLNAPIVSTPPVSLLGGLIVVGSNGPDAYSGFHILVLEPGGSDAYEDTAGGVAPFAPFPVSVVLDLAGDDVYHGTNGAPSYVRQYVQGAANLGVGALVDVCGDDRYSSAVPFPAAGDLYYEVSRAQGYGEIGVGLLADLQGDDQYNSYNVLDSNSGHTTYKVSLAQGSGQMGVGLLVDALGEDAYNSGNVLDALRGTGDAYATYVAQYCQGSAVTRGAGVLVEGSDELDASVNDLATARTLGSDLYNSHNRVLSWGGLDVGAFGGASTAYMLLCLGAAGGVPEAPSAGGEVGLEVPDVGVGPALGLLVEVTGADAYNDGNYYQARGTGPAPGVSEECRTCHVDATQRVVLNEGVAGVETIASLNHDGGPSQPGGFPALAAEPALGYVGVMVDALGHDRYNSDVTLVAEGYSFAPWQDTTRSYATYETSKSEGFGGYDGALPECADGTDNDYDGLVDWASDPDCGGSPLGHESLPQCSNGFDDDWDGFTDYPADADCSDPQDTTEGPGMCTDGWDNDGDGLTDSADPRCASSGGASEFGPCNDYMDNDGDGGWDWDGIGGYYPSDPDCGGDPNGDEEPAGPVDPLCAALAAAGVNCPTSLVRDTCSGPLTFSVGGPFNPTGAVAPPGTRLGDPIGTCWIGVLVDADGDDVHNSANRLDAKASDRNYASYLVDNDQGSSLGSGLGVMVDGFLDLEGSIKAAAQGQTFDFSVSGGTTGADTYNSLNELTAADTQWAPGAETAAIRRSLGSGNGGYGLFAEATVPAISAQVATMLAAAAISFPSSDTYNSYNACDSQDTTAVYGAALVGVGVFVELLGDDVYDQVPGCDPGGHVALLSFGYAAFSGDIALYADLGGTELYPAQAPPASPFWGPPPLANDAVWLGGAGLLGIGIDLLSSL